MDASQDNEKLIGQMITVGHISCVIDEQLPNYELGI